MTDLDTARAEAERRYPRKQNEWGDEAYMRETWHDGFVEGWEAALASREAETEVEPAPAPESKSPCEAFSWIGQSFAHCDKCGLPYWEHTHIWGVGRQVWERVPITPEDAERTRAKWEPVPAVQEGDESNG